VPGAGPGGSSSPVLTIPTPPPPLAPQAMSSLESPVQDLAYLRRVLVAAFSNGTLPRESPIFTVVARLLK